MPYRNYSNTEQPSISPQKMTSQIQNLNELRELPKVNTKDSDAVEERIRYFFNFCMERSLRPGVELLAAAIGVSRKTLLMWEREGSRRGELITQAKQLIAALLEQWELDGDINPTTAIWLQKNHFGYQDVVTVQQENTGGLSALPTKEDISKRIPQAGSVPENAEPDIDEIMSSAEEV